MPIVILDSGAPYRMPLLSENDPLDQSRIVIEDGTADAAWLLQKR